MTEAIVLLPGIISLWLVSNQSLAAAFLKLYLPVLLMLPDYYTLPIAGLPDPSFNQCCILPIGIGLCWSAVVKREWKISFLDYTVAAFLSWQVVSEITMVGMKNVPDLVFELVTLGVFPYMAGKTLIEQNNMRAAFSKRLVFCLFLVCLVSIYEFRFGVSMWRPVLGRFFPGQSPNWVTQLRWGYGRIAGPYGHAISAAFFIGTAYLLHRGLSRMGVWERHFKWAPGLPFSKAQILSGGLLLGLFMTLSRGPWLGTICGVILATAGLSRDRSRALKRAMVILIVGGAVVYAAGNAYLAGVSAFQGVEEQASAAYRAILIGQYEDIVMKSPIVGWGRANWPVVDGMKSIDNNYLFVALGNGIVGLALFVVMLCTALWRVFASGYFNEKLEPEDTAFRFTLVGILVHIAISTGTTYIGSIMYPFFFLLLGWGEACVIARPKEPEIEDELLEESVDEEYGLMRVVA